jgi:uncharacterized protein
MIAKELLDVLCCPETKAPIAPAPQELVDKLNTKIAARELRNKGGELVDTAIDGGLLRADKKVLYPIRHDIPIMLVTEAIEVDAS